MNALREASAAEERGRLQAMVSRFFGDLWFFSQTYASVCYDFVRLSMIRFARCSLISRCLGTGSEAADSGLW